MRQICVIAGLDPSAGAGLLADVQVARSLGARAVGVVTACTVQDTRGVRAVYPESPEAVGDALQALLSDVQVAAVKVGMLGTTAIAEAVARALDLTAAPVIWDPVVRPTSGLPSLFEGDPANAARLLSRHLTVCTPNLAEASALWGREVTDEAGMELVARELSSRLESAVLITGGHLPGRATDVLCASGTVERFEADRVETDGPVHGTGCALSSAIACELASGRTVSEACRRAGDYVRERLAAPVRSGRGALSVV